MGLSNFLLNKIPSFFSKILFAPVIFLKRSISFVKFLFDSKNNNEKTWFDEATERAFKAADLDGDGRLDAKELYIALQSLVDTINLKLPCRVKAPTYEKVIDIVEEFSVREEDRRMAGDGQEYSTNIDRNILFIDLEGFKRLCRKFVSFWQRCEWRDSMLYKLAISLLFEGLLLPLTAYFIRGLLTFASGKSSRLPVKIILTIISFIARNVFYR